MELSEISFKVNTSALTDAATKAKDLGIAVAGLTKEFGNLKKESAAANKAQADANLANAKAEAVLAKSAEDKAKAVDKANKTTAAQAVNIEKVAAALAGAKNAQLGFVESIERKRDLISEGWTRGESSIIKTAESLGIVGAEMQRLKSLLGDIGGLSANPFDSTLGSLRSINKEFDGLTLRSKLVSQGIELSSTQLKQYSRIAAEASVSVKKMGLDPSAGDGLTLYNTLLKNSQDEYLKVAVAAKQLQDAEKGLAKEHRATASAKAFLAKEDDKMIAVTEQLNGTTLRSITIDKQAAEAIANYKRNLQLAGIAGEEAATKLAKYSAAQQLASKREQQRVADNLSRALQPQVTDVAVSLWSGQNPLTVLLQQGGQVLDMFKLSGLEANKLGEAMKASMKGMLPSILAVGKAMGGLAVDGFMWVGTAATNTAKTLLGFSLITEGTRKALAFFSKDFDSATENIALFDKVIGGIGKVFSGIFAASAATVLLLAGTFISVMKESDALVRSLNLTGGSLGLTLETADDLGRSFERMGYSAGKAIVVLGEMSKQGGFVKSDIDKVVISAIEMEKYAGVAIEDTVKAYAKLKEKPVESLNELAIATGLVSPSIVQLVNDLVEQGKTAEATAIAMKTLSDTNSAQIARMKEDLSDFALFMKQLSTTLVDFYDKAIKALFRKASPAEVMKNEKAKILSQIQDMNYNESVLKLKPNPEVRKELDKQLEVVNSTLREYRNMDEAVSDRLAHESEISKVLKTTLANEDKFRTKAQKRTEELAREEESYKKLIAANLRTEEDWQKQKKNIEEKYKDKQVKTAAPDNTIINEYNKSLETYLDLIGQSAGETKQYNNQLEGLNSLLKGYMINGKLVKISQEEYNYALAQLEKMQPRNIKFEQEKAKALKEVADAHKLVNELLGKSSGLGSDYYDKQEKLFNLLKRMATNPQEYEMYSRMEASALAGSAAAEVTREDVLKAIEAQKQLTPEIKANKAAYEDLIKTLAGYSNELKNEADSLALETSSLYDTNEVRDRKIALMKVEIQYQKELAALQEAVRKGLTNPEQAAEALAVINQNKQTGIDLIDKKATLESLKKVKEDFDKFSGEISSILNDALFHGGKDGAVRIRKAIVAQLLKPVELVVNAVVNTLLGSALSSIGLGSGSNSLSTGVGAINAGTTLAGLSSAAGAFGGKIAGSSVGSMLGMSTPTSVIVDGVTMSGSTLTELGATFSDALSFAFDPLTLGIGALVSLISSMDDSGTLHMGGTGGYSASQGAVYGGSSATTLGFKLDADQITQAAMDAAVGISTSIVKMLDSTATAFGSQAGYYAATAFADDTSKDGAWGALMIKLGDKIVTDWGQGADKWPGREFANGSQGTADYAKALALDVRTALEAMNLPDWATKLLNNLGDAPTVENLSAVVTTINQIQAAIEYFGNTLGYSTKNVTELVNIFGDANTAMQAMSTFYENFYSEQEKTTTLTASLTKAFAALGYELPSTRAGFRQLVDTAVEAGNPQTVAGLLNLQSAFITLVPAVENTIDQLLNESRTKKRTNEEIASSILGLEQEGKQLAVNLIELTGTSDEYKAAVRALATEGFTPAETAIWDANTALSSNIELQKAAKTQLDSFNSVLANLTGDSTSAQIALLQAQGNTSGAAGMQRASDLAGMTKDLTPEQAAVVASTYDMIQAYKKETSVLVERSGLEKELLSAQGDTVALRNAELDALDPSNRALKLQIYAIEDKAKADAEAAKVAQDAADAIQKAQDEATASLKQVLDERAGLEKQILQLEGNTVALRQLELNALDPSNRALQEQIYLLEDQATALEKQNQIADERKGLEKQLLDLQGDTAAIRALELAALDPSNRALQEQIWALEDTTKATTDLTSAWQSVTNSIFDEVNRIRGLLGTGTASSFASAQSDFNAATLMARAGDQTAAEKLPQLSQALLEVASSQAGSLIDLKRIQATTANSLAQTGSILSSSNGLPTSSTTATGLVTSTGASVLTPTSGTTSLASALSNADVIAAINNLNANIDLLRAEVRADVTHNAKTAKILDRVAADGQTFQVTVAA